MPNDREIAHAVRLRPIREDAADLGLGEDVLSLCGCSKAKVFFEKVPRPPDKAGSSWSPP